MGGAQPALMHITRYFLYTIFITIHVDVCVLHVKDISALLMLILFTVGPLKMIIYKMHILLIVRLLQLVGKLSDRKPVNHTYWLDGCYSSSN